ncbi:MAG: hypothetical protein N838_31775 [Thiohalocapsa sp. PB-PSB1]|nr:MAG: hypothetical protein N838_31775 [Thiohalocapsa sp. PB-PSB1]
MQIQSHRPAPATTRWGAVSIRLDALVDTLDGLITDQLDSSTKHQ